MLEKLKRGFLLLLKGEALFYAMVLAVAGLVYLVQGISNAL